MGLVSVGGDEEISLGREELHDDEVEGEKFRSNESDEWANEREASEETGCKNESHGERESREDEKIGEK